MYQAANEARWAQRTVDRPPAAAPGAAVEQALSRVRKILTAYAAGMSLDAAQFQKALTSPLQTPAQEFERLFALGFLRWLSGSLAGAEAVLDEAVRRAPPDTDATRLGEAAYWRARVRIQLGRTDALAEYEAVLRTLGGSPQGTAWFMDVLWRAGRVDRAEQVWRSVKLNKRVAACDEGPLLEARAALRRGETAPAERVLTEASPAGGVVQVERWLLLAWIAAAQKQADKALAFIKQAEQGPYPAAALKEWRRAIERRLQGDHVVLDSSRRVPILLGELFRGHAARRAGRNDEAASAYRGALAHPFAQPFARYGLACLNQEDLDALLSSQPGLFLALHCRARLAMGRFRKRETTAAECLGALQQAHSAGFQDPGAAHFERLARILQVKEPDAELLRKFLGDCSAQSAPERRNILRAALERAVTRLPAADARALVHEWSRLGWAAADANVSRLLGRQLLRLLLLDPSTPDADALAVVERLLAGDPCLVLARALLDGNNLPGADALAGGDTSEEPVPARLSRAAAWLTARADTADGALLGQWCEYVRGLRSQVQLRGLAQALLTQEAAQRRDADAVASLLDELDHWRAFRPGPPRFVLAAVQSTVSSQPGHAAWRRCLPRWLQLWDRDALGETGAVLAGMAGVADGKASETDAPTGVPVAAWFLHRASRLLGSDDLEALACVRRALAQVPDLMERPEGAAVRQALPDLERRARAQAVAATLGLHAQTTWPVGAVVDFADLLNSIPGGQEIIRAAEAHHDAEAWDGLAALAERSDLPPRLVHHLAIVELRTAESLEDQGDPGAAEPSWRRAWRYWLVHFAGKKGDTHRSLLFEHMLGLHRKHTNALLAREAVDAARRHWNLVQELPDRARFLDEVTGEDLAARVAQFRDKLATEYLVATREVMRYGAAPEGWQADYEKGLGYLRRLLSLDRDNLRLLTALVEICGEWFLDLYRAGAGRALAEQVARFTPFALQLARLVEDRPADVAARAVLSDFYKFRGFVQTDRDQKRTLYREAQRLNPGNNNVRELLAELEGAARPDEPHDVSPP
jgi:tetratricopeptide (TPR) repeat protein